MYCKKCGEKLNDNAFVCKNCGAMVETSALDEDKQEPAKKEEPKWFLADDGNQDEQSPIASDSLTGESEMKELDDEAQVYTKPESKKTRMEMLLEKANKALMSNDKGEEDDDENYMFLSEELPEETSYNVEAEVDNGDPEKRVSPSVLSSRIEENGTESEGNEELGFRAALMKKRQEEQEAAQNSFLAEDTNPVAEPVLENKVVESDASTAVKNDSIISSDAAKTKEDKNLPEGVVADKQKGVNKAKVKKKRKMTYKVFNRITPMSVIISLFLSFLVFLSIVGLLFTFSAQNLTITENTKRMLENLKLEESFAGTGVDETIDFEFLIQTISSNIMPILITLFALIIFYLIAILLRVNIVKQKLVLLYVCLPCLISGSILYEASANYKVFAKSICSMFNVGKYVSEVILLIVSSTLAKWSVVAVILGLILAVLFIFQMIVDIIRTPNRGANEETIHRRMFGEEA